MRPYIALILTSILIFPALLLSAEPEETSVFDVVENSDESRDESVFGKIEKAAIPADVQGHGYYTSAHIVAINKITAKSRQVTVELGKSSFFDNIELKLYKCWKSSDPYIQNSQILITVSENKFDEDAKLIFEGWLISSEPALSTFEHPVYEVLAMDCAGNKVK